MPGPPPPPPPGPPPPMFPGSGSSTKSSSDGRSLLLDSIHKGVQLKKATTNDRSAPLASVGKPAASSNSGRGGQSAITPGRSNGSTTSGATGGVSNGLGGLFAGGMPKLKPTGRAIGGGGSGDGPASHGSAPTRNPSIGRGSGRHFPSDVKNRGPPPQPPPATHKPSIATSVSDGVLTNGPPSLPSKPPVGNYGKPNVAPKPPGSENKPAPPPKKLIMNGNNNNRVSVTRAQSMRAPRSPPVAPPAQPPFKHLANYSQLHENPANASYPSFHQSQDSIPNYRTNPPPRTSTLPSNLNHHGGSVKTLAPAPPSTPPPPTPGYHHHTGGGSRPVVRPPLTRPPPPPSRPPPPPMQAPPPPPHRSSPAPPPPPSAQLNRLAPGPPPTPTRHSSMRNGNAGTAGNVEMMFADRFHLESEFPHPQPFRNIPKVFNSVSVKQQAATSGKQQAPQPPMLQLGKKLYASDTSNC